ncbi:MAG: Ig-like domain-containing protein [Akkermansiaceae bacterium]|nr:Ig-like domain-containing protein [Akkermansiaceae bacterium]
MKPTLIACVALVLSGSPVIGADVPQPVAGDLAQDFKLPPHEAKPWVYWWFEGGYGNPEGMAKDMAAMKDKGIGGVMHMQTSNQGGRPVPNEPEMLGPEWDAWFGEALRLANAADMTMAASIVDGWSHGGGWVGKEDGAKQLVYSEIQVDAPGLLDVPLPMPLRRLNVYHDVAVVAFKEKGAPPPIPQEVNANSTKNDDTGDNWQAIHAVDGDPETCWGTQEPCKPQSPARLDLTFAKPLTVTSAFVAGMPKSGPKEAEILTSDDGTTFKAVARFTMEPGEQKRVEFPAATARYFRLLIPAAHTPDLQLAGFQLLRQGDLPVQRRGIKYWAFKSSNFSFFGWPPKPYAALEEEYPEDGACDVSAADVVDLSKHLQPNGMLDWKFPAGRWTVLRFGWTPLAEPARMGNGGGYEADVLSAKCADLMMDHPAKRMRELSVKHAGGAPIYFHTDSWEIGLGAKGQQPTWTDDFRQQFQKRRGYDLVTWLPAMARRIVDGRQTTDRFLWDYRATVADLLADYYGRLQERAHQMNGGMASESGYGTYPIPHMDGLKVFGRSDRPMAEFWHGGLTWAVQLRQQIDVMRTAASAARIYGKRFVQAETLTFGPTEGLFERPMKYRKTLHQAWARGLNQAVIHKYTHQPADEKPGMIDYDIFNRNFSWWPLADGLIGYMGRCQFLLQQGDFVADAAYFVGDGSFRFVPAKEFLVPELPTGYDYDGINAEVLLTRAEVTDGRLVLPPCKSSPGASGGSGPSYRYLVLTDPQCVTMTVATLGKIHQLVEAGLTLVGKRPLRTPGLSKLKQSEAVFKGHADALWGADSGDTGDRLVGKGRVIWGRPVGGILATDGIVPDCEASAAGQPYALAWLHRRVDSDEIYFLSNPLDQPAEVAVTVRAKGRVVQLFDPLDGSSRDLPENSVGTDGRTTVPLHFEPDQALFLVLSDGTPTAPDGVNFPELKPIMTVEGPWNVTFDAAWVKPLPPSVAPGSKEVSLVMAQLTDWSKRPEDGIKNYSGTANYRKSFSLPAGVRPNQPMVLDVGVVMEMARVDINGQDLGVVWCPPWRVTIPPGLLNASDNQLVITAANTWNNRLSVDAKLPDTERLTHCRAGGNGLQSAGLLGPVMLRMGISVAAKVPVRTAASRSTVAANPAALASDGVTAATITVTLRDASGNPASGKTVTLVSSRGAVDTIEAAPGDSGKNGVVTFPVKSTMAGAAVFSARNVTDHMVITPTAIVTFVPGPPHPGNSAVLASPSLVPADGTTAATVSVTLQDASGNPVSGKAVTLVSSRGSKDTVVAPPGPSDAKGLVTFSVTSATPGSAVLRATAANLANSLTQTVTFTRLASFAETNLDTSAGASGSEIRNDGTLVRACYFGEATDITVHGVPFKGAANAAGDTALSGTWGGSARLDYFPAPADANYKKLVNSLLQAPADTTGIKPTLTIGGLTVGHTYRLQIICNLPRNGVVEVAGSRHQLANGEVKTPALLIATWVASNDALTMRWIGQGVPGNPVHFTAYAVHDLGPDKTNEK